jgi:putative endonuclease
MDRRALGQLGEEAAAQYLIQTGFTILDRNWRTPQGEVDLIAFREDQLHFIEVRARASHRYGTPEESITLAKVEKLMLVAHAYLESHPEYAEDWLIDVIAVDCDSKGRVLRLDHYGNALADYLDAFE